MVETQRPEGRPARTGRVRRALVSSLHLGVAAVACGIWVGVAMPGVQLLPGVRCPFLSGPYVDREQGQPLWTVPPGSQK